MLDALIARTRALSEACDALSFAEPVHTVSTRGLLAKVAS